MKLEIKRVGNSTALILPKDVLARLWLGQRNWVLANGGLRLIPFDPTFEKGNQLPEKAMATHRNALAELAK